MRRLLVLLTVTAIPVAAFAAAPHLWAAPGTAVAGSGFVTLPPAAPAGQLALYGHIRSLTRKGQRYDLRFDPAWFTSGVTANTAAAEDKAVPKGQPVPNDYYVVDDGRRRLAFIVPPAAKVTVLTNEATKGITSTRISVAELAQVVKGRNPKHRNLFGSLESGMWILVRGDRVRSLDQQYRP